MELDKIEIIELDKMEISVEEAKEQMINEIESMTDIDRLEDEYNHFFGEEKSIEREKDITEEEID